MKKFVGICPAGIPSNKPQVASNSFQLPSIKAAVQACPTVFSSPEVSFPWKAHPATYIAFIPIELSIALYNMV